MRFPCLFLVLLLLTASCEFDASSGLLCEDGETRDDARCEGGFWVTVPDQGPNNVTNNVNNANNVNNVADMSSDIGPDAADMGPDIPACVPETDEAYCARLSLTCGDSAGLDNCQDSRTANCGTCTAPATCGGGGTPNVCGCTDQSDLEFCVANQAACGEVSAMDACNQMRTVNCSTCTGCTGCNEPDICGGGGVANQCGCTPQSDAEFCAAQGANCGTITGVDNCGTSRTLDCGGCDGQDGCGEGGRPNVCGCGADATVCAALGSDCGTVDVTALCSNKAQVICGTCNSPETCGAVTANQCACDASACPAYSCGRTTPDGCSNTVACGGCGAAQSCSNGTCVCSDCMNQACSEGQRCSTSDETRFCDAAQTCCNPSSDAILCFNAGLGCGLATITDDCGVTREIDCGGCLGPNTCGAVTANQCGCDITACSQFACGVQLPIGCLNSIDCGGCGAAQTCTNLGVCRCDDCSNGACSVGQPCPGVRRECKADGSCD